jgi:DNA polymerase III subunit gamma/tau
MTGTHYKALTRKYRPQIFSDVLSQDPLITTLKNALKEERVSHAYMFSGSRGTGKTTLARVLSKALNCKDLSSNSEPCNRCQSCEEIVQGCSLDVIEIDGASHRGIDDIRKINDTISFSPSNKYKIYIIDEVHMLTKEAFNALLKTLEEPPANVKFFFATTEPHKVPATIISRCQRFNLRRISEHDITKKLNAICDDLVVDTEKSALHLIAHQADGSLRDAESLLDQVLAFHKGSLTLAATQDILGTPERDLFYKLDEEGKKENYFFAYELTEDLYTKGKNFHQFLDGLVEHFRILLHLLASQGKFALPSSLSEKEKELYQRSASLYKKEQILDILENILKSQKDLKTSPSPQVTIEMLLLSIMRSHHELPIESIMCKLIELEEKLLSDSSSKKPEPMKIAEPPLKNLIKDTPPLVKRIEQRPKSPPQQKKPQVKEIVESKPKQEVVRPRINIDIQTKSRFDTLMRFAAVELKGSLKKN